MRFVIEGFRYQVTISKDCWPISTHAKLLNHLCKVFVASDQSEIEYQVPRVYFEVRKFEGLVIIRCL